MEDSNPLVQYKNSKLGDVFLLGLFLLSFLFLVLMIYTGFLEDSDFVTKLTLYGSVGILFLIIVAFVFGFFKGIQSIVIFDNTIELVYFRKKYSFTFDQLQDLKTNVFGGKANIYRIYFVSPQGKKFYIPLTGKKGKEVFDIFKQKINKQV